MRKWHNLIIILIIMSLFGCRTMDGQGSAAGAGTYPLKSTPAAEDTVLLTVVDGTKAGGFDIRRTPVANMPVSTPVSTALALKQNASSAITESDVQGIVDDAVAGIPGSTVVADTTDPTKAAVSVLADAATTAASVDPIKTPGVPGMMAVHEADGTSTLKTGFIGPANSSLNFVYQFPNGIPLPGDTWVAGTALTGQTLPDGSTGTIIPLTHSAGGGSGVPDGTSANDILSWDGDSWEPIALTAHPAFSSLLTAFSNAGLNSFTFPSSSIYPIYTNDATYTLTVDVTDTSTTCAVNAVNYKLGSGEYAAMTNTTGDTWSVTLPTQTDGTYDLQFNAADGKSTPNTGESAVYPGALIVDLTAPVIVAGADSTHDGSTPVTATMALTELYPDPSTLLYTVTGGTPASGTWAGTGPNYSLEVTPAGTDPIVVTSSASDLAGNAATGTRLTQTFTQGSACATDSVTTANEGAFIAGINLGANAAGQSFQVTSGATALSAIGIYVSSTSAGASLELRWGSSPDLTTSYESTTLTVDSTDDGLWKKAVFTTKTSIPANTTRYFGVVLLSGDVEIGSHNNNPYANGTMVSGTVWNMATPNASYDLMFRIYQCD